MTKIRIREESSLVCSNLIHWNQFLQKTGISPYRLAELIDMGWVHYVCTQSDNYLFPHHEIFRVQKLVRICKDFELPTLAGMIIVDLLERTEQLEKKIKQLQNLI